MKGDPKLNEQYTCAVNSGKHHLVSDRNSSVIPFHVISFLTFTITTFNYYHIV